MNFHIFNVNATTDKEWSDNPLLQLLLHYIYNQSILPNFQFLIVLFGLTRKYRLYFSHEASDIYPCIYLSFCG
jgi:hypothetical protein